MDLKNVEQKLSQFLRPATYPVALSIVASREELPDSFAKAAEKASPMLVCQGITLARRYGWKVCLSPRDMVCPLGAMAVGFAPPSEGFLSGDTGVPNWVCDDAARSVVAEAIPKLPHGEDGYLIAEPLAQAGWEPQLIIVYGNPAQMVRLVQALVHHTGRALSFSALGGIGCASYISQALITGQCQMVPCGAGDRIFAMAQDDEMAFAIPAGEVDKVLSGLEFTSRAGLRYPVTPYMRFHTEMPATYQALMKNLTPEE
ncbi:MAG: DUF169 domain-containing protein [Desulfarculaceae bacterium]|nr:DUF169 domain-containing protein [Desulfarculaceae bacterium]MCF8048340.1 DUF169 domain-containing protein [Desulfarculaceae bacterium]MCF8064546.1 DUF169 domain-containing protein [Desulfarculaceae bacterium]MCF8099322.1 DUF169 domain-containing protein [Desulfarculaceae bacterium]MCF8123277.1 DUF169 domain-containing protein [Desulfarculaceae bacterium]